MTTIKVGRIMYCRFCQADRPIIRSGRIICCAGCGSSAHDAKAVSGHASTPKERRVECPRCSKEFRADIAVSDSRYVCPACGDLFEATEQTYIDDRPEINAQRIEAYKRPRGYHKGPIKKGRRHRRK